MADDYIFGNRLRLFFKVVSRLRGLVSNSKNDTRTFETVEMVGAPFDKWEKYLLRYEGVDSEGNEEFYVGARKDSRGRIWHRFVLSTLETDVSLGWPLCITDICEDSYRIKDNSIYLEGNNYLGPQIQSDSEEGKAIINAWFKHGRKNKQYSLAV